MKSAKENTTPRERTWPQAATRRRGPENPETSSRHSFRSPTSSLATSVRRQEGNGDGGINRRCETQLEGTMGDEFPMEDHVVYENTYLQKPEEYGEVRSFMFARVGKSRSFVFVSGALRWLRRGLVVPLRSATV